MRNSSIWGVRVELRMPTRKGEGTWVTQSYQAGDIPPLIFCVHAVFRQTHNLACLAILLVISSQCTYPCAVSTMFGAMAET